jgi:flagellar basal body-associated protein FliL
MAENLKKDGKDEKKKGGMSPDLKWLALGFGFALTTVGASFLGVHFYVSQFMIAKAKAAAEEEAKLHKPKVRSAGPSVPLLNSQIINLKGGRYLKFSIVLQYVQDDVLWPPGGGGNAGAKKVDPLEKYGAFMKDVTIETIAGYSAEELKTDAGRSRLRTKIRDNLNAKLKEVFGPPPAPPGQHAPAAPAEKKAEEAPAEEGEGGGGNEGEHHGPPPLPEVMNVFFTEFVVS